MFFEYDSAMYTYCELEPLKEGQARNSPIYETKAWAPPALTLQEIASRLKLTVLLYTLVLTFIYRLMNN